MNMDDDGPAGSVPDGATGYQIDKATFAKQLAQRLNDAALKGCLRRPGADRRRTDPWRDASAAAQRSEEHTSELQSLMRISYAGFCLKKHKTQRKHTTLLILACTHTP